MVVEVEAVVDDNRGVAAALVVSDIVELTSYVVSGPGELALGPTTVLSVGGRGVLGDDDELVCDVDIVVVVVVDASVVAVVTAVEETVDVEVVCVVAVVASVDVVAGPVSLLVETGNDDVSRTVVGSV